MTHHTHKLTLQNLEDRTVPAGGVLDPTFGTAGIVRVDYPDSWRSQAQELLIQPDGKIITVGVGEGGVQTPAISRFNPDGSYDASFGNNGTVLLESLPTGYGEFYDAALQPDGKIVASGTSRDEGDYGTMVVRFNSDGSLDESFGENGIVLVNVLQNSMETSPGDDNGFCVAVGPDGKIVVGGNTFGGQHHDYFALRLTSAGELDTTFSNDGLATIPSRYGLGGATDMVILEDNKILIGGGDLYSGGEGFVLARFNVDGSLDTTFASQGIFSQLPPGTSTGILRHFTLQPDGKILAAGHGQLRVSAGMGQPTLARFNPDGTLDTTFGDNGWVIQRVYEGGGEYLNVTLDQDQNIVAVGFMAIPGGSISIVASYNPDGTLNTSFGTEENSWIPGVVKTDLATGNNDEFRTVGIAADGAIIAAGVAGGSATLVRYGEPNPNTNPNPVPLPIEVVGDVIRLTTSSGSDFVRITQRSDRTFRFEIKTPSNIYRQTIKLPEEYTHFSAIEVDLGGGNDRLLTVKVNVPMLIHGGTGNDYLQGSFGADTIYGEAGGDTIFGKKGDDWIDAGDGDNVVSGGDGDDTLSADDGFNVIHGGNGNDLIAVGNGGNVLTGGAGSDSLTGGHGSDWIKGGNGIDIIFGGEGNDLLEGGFGRDFLVGGLGKDTLLGGWGSDILVDGNVSLNDADSFSSILANWDPLETESYQTIRALFQVENDPATDRMRGGKGIDWFFGDNEIFLSDISGIENWN